MNKNNIALKLSLILFTCCLAFQSYAQGNKVIFVKEVPVKLKSQSSYTFFIGYEVEEDSDIAMDISGGPSEFWAGETVAVQKGKGVFQFKITPREQPRTGKGYRILVSVRESGGDWKTEKASSIIRNVEIVNKEEPILDDASFSLLTPTSISSRDVFEFDIDYKASEPRLLQVALWNGQQWIAASKNTTVQPGEGSVKVTVSAGQPKEGNKYRYVLYYGSGDGFPNENIVSKELSGIQITKAIKTLTLDDLKEKCLTISPNKDSNNLTLPGDLSYEYIRIISMQGAIVKEVTNTNSIPVNDLKNGPYYVITSKDDYYQFVKL